MQGRVGLQYRQFHNVAELVHMQHKAMSETTTGADL